MTIFLHGGIALLKEIIGIRIYKKVATDIVEIITYFNIVVFAVFSLSDLRGNIPMKCATTSYVSTLLALILLLGIIINHAVDLTGYNYVNLIWKEKMETPPVTNAPPQTSECNNVTHTELDFFETDVPYIGASNCHRKCLEKIVMHKIIL